MRVDDRRRIGWAVVLWVLLPLFAGCTPGGTPGERLYRRHCDSCHGVDGSGGMLYLADEGANLLDETWKYGGERSDLEYSLMNDDVTKHKSWDFTPQERRELVDHILFLRGERR
jgi:mono/diheme cytochrome c family protein